LTIGSGERDIEDCRKEGEEEECQRRAPVLPSLDGSW
jgi:hypothetical protein